MELLFLLSQSSLLSVIIEEGDWIKVEVPVLPYWESRQWRWEGFVCVREECGVCRDAEGKGATWQPLPVLTT